MFEIKSGTSRYNFLSSEISRITKSNPHLSYRSIDEINKSINSGEFIFAFKNSDLAGFAEVQQIWLDWYGIFSFFVYPTYRNKGLAKEILKKIMFLNKNKKIYAATSNKIMLKILERSGFKRTALNQLPVLFLINYFSKRFINKELLVNLKNINKSWYYLVYFK